MTTEDMYRNNYNIVYGYLITLSGSKHIAEELTAETFYKAIRNIDKFDGKGKISSWLCQIAKNEYFKYYNKNKKNIGFINPVSNKYGGIKSSKGSNNYSDENEIENIADDYNLEEMFIDKEMAMHIHMLLHKLPEPYKEVFVLRIFAELSFLEIAEIFDKSESWARVTFYRAKLKIRELMEE